jgi:hypothetical protein
MVRRRGGTPGGYDPGGDGGGSDDTGGADDASPGPATGGGSPSFPGGVDPEPPDDDPDPSPGPSAPSGAPSVPGGVDPEPPEPDPSGETAVLDDLGQAYTETVAEPVGDFTAATNPIAQAEKATLGTNRIARVSEGFGEGVAQIGNVPGNTAAAIDTVQTIDQARSRATDPVTVGGVPTGVTVPDLEGQERNTEAAAGAAAGAAAAAAERPFETTGRVIGGALGGAAASRGIARVAGRTGSSSGSSSGAVPSGRSQVGTGGRGSVLEEIDVDAERGISSPSTASRVRGEVGRTVDDVTDAVSDAVDPLVPDAGETGTLRSGLVPESATERRTPDAPDDFDRRPPDAGGTFEDIRDDALTQIQDDLRGRGQRPDPGDFERAPQPFRDRGGDTIDADAGVQLQRSTATPDLDVGGVDNAAGFGAAGPASATGLGALSAVNDPTQVAGTEAVTGTESRAGSRGGTGAGSFGTLGVLSGVNDPSQVAPTDDSDTGTDVGTDLGTDTAADVGADTLGDTGSTGVGDGDTRTEPIPQLRGRTTVGAQQAPGSITDTAAGTQIVAEPDVATDIGADGFATRTGFGFGGGTTTRGRPRGEEEQDEDEEAPLFGLAADADRIDSGIASGTEQLEDIASGFGLNSR